MKKTTDHWLRWGSMLLFLMALCLPVLGCGPQAQVQVAVEGPLAEGTQLGGVVRWSGTDERELPTQSATTGTWREGRAYVLTMPAAAQFGEVTVRLRLRDDAGCVVAEGSGAVDVAAQRSYKVTVSLVRGAPCRPELRVERVGVGFGRVVSEPAGIDCELRLQAGGSCAAGFPKGTKVRLRATVAATGIDASVFAGWRGPCQGAGECEVTMDGPLTATARLRPQPVCSRDGFCHEAPFAAGPATQVQALWGLGPSDVWAMTTSFGENNGSQAIHWNGAFWAPISMGPESGNLIRGLHGLRSDSVFAVGSSGFVSRWDGATWTRLAPPGDENLFAVWVAADDVVWVAGTTTVFRCSFDLATKRCASWERFAASVRALSGAGRDSLWAVGEGGAIWSYDAVGKALRTVASPTMNRLTKLAAHPTGGLWAVGDKSTLLRYDAAAQRWLPEALPALPDQRLLVDSDLSFVGDELWLVGCAEFTGACYVLKRRGGVFGEPERLFLVNGGNFGIHLFGAGAADAWFSHEYGLQRWSGMNRGPHFLMMDLCGASPEDLWLIGRRLDDQGNNVATEVLRFDGDSYRTVLTRPEPTSALLCVKSDEVQTSQEPAIKFGCESGGDEGRRGG